MSIEAAPSLYPLSAWAPLAAAIFTAQVGLAAACLKPGLRGAVRVAIALLLADAVLVVLIRRCAAFIGAMDYSESFFVWRWGFLALVVIAGGMSIPLWAIALRLAVGHTSYPQSDAPMIHPAFRAVLLLWGATGVTVLAAGGSFTFIPRPARITRIEVPIDGLPAALRGLRIAALSDLHVGPLVTPARARRRLESLSRAEADLIVVLGDITHMDPRYQPEAASIVGACRAQRGTYAVSGNFDVRCGTDSLRDELARVGVVYLENEAEPVRVNGATFWIIGIGDAWTGQEDLEAALEGVPEGAFTILLSHSPDIVERAVERRLQVVLSGHLHGGQVVIPFAGPIVGMSKFGTRFAAGHFLLGPTHLVVSRGLGEEAIPVRLFCPPEILLVTLQSRS